MADGTIPKTFDSVDRETVVRLIARHGAKRFLDLVVDVLMHLAQRARANEQDEKAEALMALGKGCETVAEDFVRGVAMEIASCPKH